MCILCVRVKTNKCSFEPFVFGSCFRTLAVILFQIVIVYPVLLYALTVLFVRLGALAGLGYYSYYHCNYYGYYYYNYEKKLCIMNFFLN